MHLRVRLRRRSASHRSGRYRTLGTQSELTGKQFVGAALVHHEHDQVRLRSADLEADATAFNPDSPRSRPARAAFTPAGDISLAIFAANQEGGCLQAGNDDDTVSIRQHFFR